MIDRQPRLLIDKYTHNLTTPSYTLCSEYGGGGGGSGSGGDEGNVSSLEFNGLETSRVLAAYRLSLGVNRAREMTPRTVARLGVSCGDPLGNGVGIDIGISDGDVTFTDAGLPRANIR